VSGCPPDAIAVVRLATGALPALMAFGAPWAASLPISLAVFVFALGRESILDMDTNRFAEPGSDRGWLVN
jgi:hypothetical protein